MTKIVIDPITRLEGHLKIEVTVEGGQVVDARATGTLFRGMETILRGRPPADLSRRPSLYPTGSGNVGVRL